MEAQGSASPNAETKIKLLSNLPKDVLIEIFCHSLYPHDLIAVSQVCRTLRACSYSKTAWVRAWARDHSLPPFETPELVLPSLLSRQSHDSLDSGFLFAEVTAETIEPFPGAIQTPTYTSHRERYLQLTQIRQRLRSETPLVSKHIASDTVPNFPSGDWRRMMFSPGGEVFILWRPLGFMIVDLRPGGLKYEVPLETSITGRGWCLSLAAKLFIHNGVEGVVVAATFLKPKRINLLFLPFSTRGTFVHLADLVPHSTAGLSDFFFSGSHLIIVETGNSDDSFIQIYDLVHGTSYLVSVDAFLRKVQIFDESYLLVAVPPGVVLGAHLQRFRSDEHPVPFPAADGQDAWVIAKIDQTNWKSSILIPRASIPSHRLSSIKHDETKRLMCPIWGLAQDHPWNTHRGGWHSKTALVTIGHIPLDQPLTNGHASVSSYTHLDGSRSLNLFPPTPTTASQRSTELQLSAPFTAAHLPNHGRMNPRGPSRRSISEPTRIVVFAYRRPFGESQLLSATASPDVRLEGIVLSQFSFDTLEGPKIEHKLVHSWNNEGNIIPLSHNEESDPQRLNILWNEPAGTIAVVTDNREDRVHRVHFYQVQV